MSDQPGHADPSAGVPEDPLIGRVLQERYRVTQRIAAGGMGVVYRGERLGLGRVVAIKFLHAEMARDPQILRRFEIEAQAMSRLHHPNCVGVLDFGVDEYPYVVIDYVEGAALDTVIAGGPLPSKRAIKILRQILSALVHAHAQGIVHRDIKPENILIEGSAGLADHVRILDFGLAKLSGSDFGLTAGFAVGTPHYMAPEQMGEKPVDARADIYATGIVFFELLTGRKPFEGDEIGDVLLKHLGTPPPKVREVYPAGRFSREIEALIVCAMAKKPEDRFASAAAMAAALEEVPEAIFAQGAEVGAAAQGFEKTRAAPIAGARANESNVGTDATQAWSSANALPVPFPGTPGPETLGPEVPPAPRFDLPDPPLDEDPRRHDRDRDTWHVWLFERPFWMALGGGLGATLLACALLALGLGGRRLPTEAGKGAGTAAPTASVQAPVKAREGRSRGSGKAATVPIFPAAPPTKTADAEKLAPSRARTVHDEPAPKKSRPHKTTTSTAVTKTAKRESTTATSTSPGNPAPAAPKRKPFLKWL